MNGERYLEILKNKVPTHMDIHQNDIFMHDGAPCHRSKLVKQWLPSQEISVLEWPGNSPDCNPIENVLENTKGQSRGAETYQ